MEFVFDDVDKRIIAMLKKNSRESFINIAKEIGLSEGSIRKRVKDMIKNKVIGKFTIETNEILYPVRAVVMVRLASKAPFNKILEFVRKMPGSNSAYPVTGAYDIFVELGAPNTNDLYKKITSIRNQNGVVTTLTMTLLS